MAKFRIIIAPPKEVFDIEADTMVKAKAEAEDIYIRRHENEEFIDVKELVKA